MIINKYPAHCVCCHKIVPAGEGFCEKKSVLNQPGDGWATRHRNCTFTPMPQRRVSLWRRPEPDRIEIMDSFWHDNVTMGMTESEFFGGDVGDKG